MAGADEMTPLDIEGYSVQMYPTLGNGAYGVVYKAQNKTTDEPAVMKEILLNTKEKKKSAASEQAVINRLMLHSKHKNIIILFGIIWGPDAGAPEKLRIFMEYCQLGHLAKYLLKTFLEINKSISLLEKVDLMQQCASGIAFLHDKSIIHRDIKFENILVTIAGEEIILKFTDFGISKLYPQRKHSTSMVFKSFEKMKTNCGTLQFQAPEFFAGESYNGSIDVFSIGLVFAILLEIEHEYDSYDTECLEIPRSVRCKEEKEYFAFGQEMYQCAKDNKQPPVLINSRSGDSNNVIRLKRIITQMTQLTGQARKRIHDVELELKEIINSEETEFGQEQNTKTDDNTTAECIPEERECVPTENIFNTHRTDRVDEFAAVAQSFDSKVIEAEDTVDATPQIRAKPEIVYSRNTTNGQTVEKRKLLNEMLSDEDTMAIQKLFHTMKTNMTTTDVITRMFSSLSLTRSQKEEVDVKMITTSEKAGYLLTRVMKGTYKDLVAFKTALIESNQHYLANMLPRIKLDDA